MISDSPSGRSNGERFDSAVAAIMNRTNPANPQGVKTCQCAIESPGFSACFSTTSTSDSEPTVIITAIEGVVCGLHGQRPADAIRFPGAQRQQEMPRLKIRGANGIRHTQALRDRPAGVDANDLLRRDTAGVGLAETEASQVDEQAAEQDGQKSPPWGWRQPHSRRSQHVAKHADSLFQVTAHEQLGGSPAAIIHDFVSGCAGGRGEICLRRFGAAPRVTEGITELDPKIPLPAAIFHLQFQRLQFQGKPV